MSSTYFICSTNKLPWWSSPPHPVDFLHLFHAIIICNCPFYIIGHLDNVEIGTEPMTRHLCTEIFHTFNQLGVGAVVVVRVATATRNTEIGQGFIGEGIPTIATIDYNLHYSFLRSFLGWLYYSMGILFCQVLSYSLNK